MERVIGGWINYTVVREGSLTPERVVLGDVITDVVGVKTGPASRARTADRGGPHPTPCAPTAT